MSLLNKGGETPRSEAKAQGHFIDGYGNVTQPEGSTITPTLEWGRCKNRTTDLLVVRTGFMF